MSSNIINIGPYHHIFVKYIHIITFYNNQSIKYVNKIKIIDVLKNKDRSSILENCYPSINTYLPVSSYLLSRIFMIK